MNQVTRQIHIFGNNFGFFFIREPNDDRISIVDTSQKQSNVLKTGDMLRFDIRWQQEILLQFRIGKKIHNNLKCVFLSNKKNCSPD